MIFPNEPTFVYSIVDNVSGGLAFSLRSTSFPNLPESILSLLQGKKLPISF